MVRPSSSPGPCPGALRSAQIMPSPAVRRQPRWASDGVRFPFHVPIYVLTGPFTKPAILLYKYQFTTLVILLFTVLFTILLTISVIKASYHYIPRDLPPFTPGHSPKLSPCPFTIVLTKLSISVPLPLHAPVLSPFSSCFLPKRKGTSCSSFLTQLPVQTHLSTQWYFYHSMYQTDHRTRWIRCHVFDAHSLPSSCLPSAFIASRVISAVRRFLQRG